MTYMRQNPELIVNEIKEKDGRSLLHETTFHDATKCFMALMELGKQTLSTKLIDQWVNLKDKEDNFTALHFASFRGNVDMCEILLENGAYIHAENNYGINVLHTAV